MRNESEIRERLETAKQNRQHANEWYKEALKRYQEEIKVPGNTADTTEIDSASNIIIEFGNEVILLEWVLADVKPRIPIKINTDEGDE